jgi:hypothetical protein
MAEKKDTVKDIGKVKDYNEVVKGVTGLVRESYQNGFEFALALWEENLKVLNTQVDQWLNIHQDYTNSVKDIYEKFPKDVAGFWDGKGINNEFNRLLTFQKEYLGFFRNASEKFTKETLNLTKKNVEKALSLFDEYLNLVRI